MKGDEVKFSVVVPVYNKARYLGGTIDSVLAQTEGSFELLIIDDGSTDDSCDVALSSGDDRLRLIRKANGGVSSARNLGIQKARGQYVSFLDADDRWAQNYLAVIDGLVDKYGGRAGVFTTAYAVVDGTKVTVPNGARRFGGKADGLLYDYVGHCTRRYAPAHSSSLTVERTLLDRVGQFAEGCAVGEDLDLQLRLSAVSPYAFSTEVCAFYNRSTESNARTRNRVFDPFSYLETIDLMLEEGVLSQRDRRALRQIRDRKQTARIFSKIGDGQRSAAKAELAGWRPSVRYWTHRVALLAAILMPPALISGVRNSYYGIR